MERTETIPRTIPLPLLLAAALALAPLSLAAQPEAEPPASPAAATSQATAPATPGAGAAQRPELAPVPKPAVEGLEGTVVRQLEEMQELVEGLVDDPATGVAELASAFGEMGRLYLAYELLDPAEAAFRNARRLAPEEFRWHYYLAYLHQQAGRLAEAVPPYAAALALDPHSVPALVRLGDALLEQNLPEDAAPLYRRALELDSSCAAAKAGLGQIALAAGRYTEAAEHFEAVLAQVPGATKLHYSLGLAYRGLGEMDKAREQLAQRGIVGIRPADPLVDGLVELKSGERVLQLRGRQAYRAGDLEAAAEAFRQAVAASPESPSARINLAVALAQTGDVEGAVAELREAARLAPDNVTARLNLGSLLRTSGRAGEAVPFLERAVELASDDKDAHLELARALKESGRVEEALAHFAAAARLAPGAEEPWIEGADALLRLGRHAEAKLRLEQAHGLMPDQGRIAYALARVLAASPDLAQRDGQKALELAARVYQAQPTVGHAETVAMALAEVGRCEEAAQWQRRALDAVESSGDAATAQRLRQILSLYEGGPPCRYPGAAEETDTNESNSGSS